MEKFEQNITKETFPADFPMPVIFTPEQIKERDERKVESPYDENCFYFKDGQLDKEWINNMWYTLRSERIGQLENAKPKDIEIQDFGQFLSGHIPFNEIFQQSAGFKQMMGRPENDPKRQQVIDYISEMVNNTLSTDLRERVNRVPGLSEKIKDYIKNEILRDVFFMNENQKWNKNVDQGNNEKEPEELLKFRKMIEETFSEQKVIRETLKKEKLW